MKNSKNLSVTTKQTLFSLLRDSKRKRSTAHSLTKIATLLPWRKVAATTVLKALNSNQLALPAQAPFFLTNIPNNKHKNRQAVLHWTQSQHLVHLSTLITSLSSSTTWMTVSQPFWRNQRVKETEETSKEGKGKTRTRQKFLRMSIKRIPTGAATTSRG